MKTIEVKNLSKIYYSLIILILIVASVTSFLVFKKQPIEIAQAANFSIKTGYYLGTGAARSITGLGFTPDCVFIKSDPAGTGTKGGVFRTSSMSSDSTAYSGYNGANATSLITSLDSDGFTIGTSADVNVAGRIYQYTAFTGSGGANYKVGSYTGNGADNTDITGVGFQPDLVMIKGDYASYLTWRSSSMSGDSSQHLVSGTFTLSNLIQSFGADGFQIGTSTTVNNSGSTYYYIAFKSTSGTMNVGSYSGDGLDDKLITGVGFQPNWMFLKHSGTYAGIQRTDQQNGDASFPFTTGYSIAANRIQAFGSDGFQIGTDSTVNHSGSTFYYAAFGGASSSSPSGTFSMKTGTYYGKNTAQSITGLGFSPDLVIIRCDRNAYAIFKTSIVKADNTPYFHATASGGGLITSLDSDGFTVGTAVAANYANYVYQYTAFGNSGSTNFKIGAYTGTGGDDRTINNIGFQPDLVLVKTSSSSALWRSSRMVGDISEFFDATNEAANLIQAMQSDGFQVGTDAKVNGATVTYLYVAFKVTTGTMAVGGYTGNATDDRNITDLGFQPNFAFTKLATAATASAAATKNGHEHGDASNTFLNTDIHQNRIQAFGADGFQVGTDATVNADTGTYYYAAFGGEAVHSPPTANSKYYMKVGSYSGTAVAQSITGFGFRPDMVIVKSNNGGTDNEAVLATSAMGGLTGPLAVTINMSTYTTLVTSLDSDGFTIGVHAKVNTNGVTYQYYAFGNSGCANFKVGAYTSNYAQDNRSITGIGFQPDSILVLNSASTLGRWKTPSMAGEISVRLNNISSATIDIKALEADGFKTGTGTGGNYNGAGVTFYYVAFKNESGNAGYGLYSGNGSDNRDITGLGFQPDLVWIKNYVGHYAIHRSSNLVGDTTQYFYSTANAENLIQSLNADGFQVGTDNTVNYNGSDHYYMAWKIIPPDLQQIRYRWRMDDGSESTATAAANENTAITGLAKDTIRRIRFEISNEGWSQASSYTYKIEYGEKDTTCAAIITWTALPTSPTTEHWQIADSGNLTDSDSTTNVSSLLTDENTTFVAGQVKDAGNQTAGITLTPTNFTETEFSIKATTSATNSGAYCFRLTNAGATTNFTYTQYPEVTLEAGSNTAPVVSSDVSLNNNANISLTENTTKAVNITATVTDAQGCSTISTVTAKAYRSSVTPACTADNNNCYSVSCSQNEGSCTGEGDNDAVYTCTVNIYYFAQPTDSGSPWEDDIWGAGIQATDTGSLTGNGTNSGQNIELYTLRAIDATPIIDYGSLSPNSGTGTLSKEVTVTNTGNADIDVELSGENMARTGGGSIDVGQQEYASLSDTNYGDGQDLSGIATRLEVDLSKPTSQTAITDIIYWGIFVPLNALAGDYNGTNIIGALAD